MKRFQVHASRPYRDDDLALPRVFLVTASRFECRSGWLVFIDDKNSDVAIFSQNEIAGAVPFDVAAATTDAQPLSDLA